MDGLKKAVIVAVDGSRAVIEFDDDSLLAIAQQVVGGYIEGVQVAAFDEMEMYVNEEGLLDGLPLNIFASMLAGKPIVGDAIVVGATDEDGYSNGLTSDQINRLS